MSDRQQPLLNAESKAIDETELMRVANDGCPHHADQADVQEALRPPATVDVRKTAA